MNRGFMKESHLIIIFMILFLLSPTVVFADPLQEARQFSAAGENEKALELYTSWLSDNETSSLFPDILEESLSIIKDPDEQLTYLSVLKSRLSRQKTGVINIRSGILLEMLGNIEQALTLYEDVSYGGTTGSIALLRAAELRFQVGDTQKAELQARAILGTTSDQAQKTRAIVLLSRISCVKGEREAAEQLMRDVPDPSEPSYILWLALLKDGEGHGPLDEAFLAGEVLPYSGALDTFGLLPDPQETEKNPEESAILTGPAVTDPELISIQIGSFLDRENAEYRILDLEKVGIEGAIVEIERDEKIYFRVIVPDIPYEKLQEEILRLKTHGFEGFPLYE